MKALVFIMAVMVLIAIAIPVSADDACLECHSQMSPGQVSDWKASAHAENDVTCSTCHGKVDPYQIYRDKIVTVFSPTIPSLLLFCGINLPIILFGLQILTSIAFWRIYKNTFNLR